MSGKHGVRVGTLAPDVLLERLSAAIEDAYGSDNTAAERLGGQAPAWELPALVAQWAYRVEERSFIRWDCDSDDCPSRPAWEAVLSEALSDRGRLAEHMADVMRAWLMGRLVAFAQAHPEARLAPVGDTDTQR